MAGKIALTEDSSTSEEEEDVIDITAWMDTQHVPETQVNGAPEKPNLSPLTEKTESPTATPGIIEELLSGTKSTSPEQSPPIDVLDELMFGSSEYKTETSLSSPTPNKHCKTCTCFEQK